MKLVEINSFNFGSTGKIMNETGELAEKNGYKVYYCVPRSRSNLKKNIDNQIFIGNIFSRNLHLFLAKITGLNGCFSILSTFIFLKKLRRINPDIIHLHNLHNCYINLPMLFHYIKRYKIKTVWTLHDCWSFTGQCPHFSYVKCEKWKTGCQECPQYKNYPSSFLDQTKLMWKFKKRWFSNVDNLTIVSPSEWLASLVKKSFLKDYPIEVINNGIDLNLFTPKKSDFRKKYHIEEKYMVLGVANPWSEKKGIDVFIKLSKLLDNRFKIVLVGTDDEIDKILPDEIISIHKTQNVEDLVKIYSSSDVFVQTTREENYPTVNMEALACGIPVITFDTGGCKEISDESCGILVPCDDIKKLKLAIENECFNKLFDISDCLNRAKSFNKDDKFINYLELYKKLTDD